MHHEFVNWLICPACYGELTWQINTQTATRIVDGTATCRQCGASYPIRDEIALFLTPDLPRDDLWAQAESNLGKFFRSQPDLEKQLFESPLENLNGADLYLRGS